MPNLGQCPEPSFRTTIGTIVQRVDHVFATLAKHEGVVPHTPYRYVVQRTLYDGARADAVLHRSRAHGLFDNSIVDYRIFFVADETVSIHEGMA